MRLFQGEAVSSVKLSLEEFSAYYQSASVLAQEAMSDYFYKLKDSFNTLSSSLLNLDNDKVVTDVLSTRFETEHRIKRIKFVDVKDIAVLKPENFKGKYIDFSHDLLTHSDALLESTELTLDNLKLAISSFINEYTEDKAQILYGYTYFKEADKLTEKTRKAISSYFPEKNNSVKAHVEDVLKTLSDVPVIYNNIQKLDGIINLNRVKEINKLAKECTELVDVLIEQNTNSGILLKNDRTKKELVEVLHIAAKEVELVSYMYSNTMFFYSSVKALSEVILNQQD